VAVAVAEQLLACDDWGSAGEVMAVRIEGSKEAKIRKEGIDIRKNYDQLVICEPSSTMKS
jgi:hypothetical protein